MNSNLEASLNFILQDEGQWVEKPNGAIGKFGIGMATLIAWRNISKGIYPTVADLRNLTDVEAKAIYSSKLYAANIGFDTLPIGLDYAALDAATNEGSGMGDDSKPGAKLLLLMTADVADVMERVKAISAIRLDRKSKRPDWNDYIQNGVAQRGHGAGWTNRIGIWVPRRAQAMIDGAAK